MKKTISIALIAGIMLSHQARPVQACFFEAQSSGNRYVYDFSQNGTGHLSYDQAYEMYLQTKRNAQSAVSDNRPAPSNSSASVDVAAQPKENPQTKGTPPTDVPKSLPEISPKADLDELGQAVFQLMNEQREQAGLPALKQDKVLTEMAMLRARELAQRFSHTRPDGSKCGTVFAQYDTELQYRGENAAMRHKSPESVMNGWMESKGHRFSILREGTTYAGVGVWQDDKGVLYWTQLFAK